MYLTAPSPTPTAKPIPWPGRWTPAAGGHGALRRFGYITLTSETDNLLCRGGESIPAHEFHYYDSDDCGGGCLAKKPLRSASWRCVHTSPTLFAGFPISAFTAIPPSPPASSRLRSDTRRGHYDRRNCHITPQTGLRLPRPDKWSSIAIPRGASACCRTR
jgi:hypothetical protein